MPSQPLQLPKVRENNSVTKEKTPPRQIPPNSLNFKENNSPISNTGAKASSPSPSPSSASERQSAPWLDELKNNQHKKRRSGILQGKYIIY